MLFLDHSLTTRKDRLLSVYVVTMAAETILSLVRDIILATAFVGAVVTTGKLSEVALRSRQVVVRLSLAPA